MFSNANVNLSWLAPKVSYLVKDQRYYLPGQGSEILFTQRYSSKKCPGTE